MKLTIPQPALASVVARGGSVAPKNSPVPIMNHVRLVATDGMVLSVASTDLDRFAEASAMASVEVPGETTVPAAALAALVSRHPKDKDVSLEIEGGFLIVKCGRSKVKLPTLPAEDFSVWGEHSPTAVFTMKAADLAKAFARTRPVCEPGAVAAHGGVYMHLTGGKLKFAATNKHHFAVASLDVPAGAETMPNVIVPLEVIDTAMRLMKGVDEVEVRLDEHKVAFVAGDGMITSKLIASGFYDYERAIPARGSPAMNLDRAELGAAMDRAALTTEEGVWSGFALIPREDGVELKSMTGLGGETREGLSGTADAGFAPFTFNPAYLARLSAAMDGPVISIECAGRGKAILVFDEADDSFVGMIGPMATNEAMVA